MVDHSGHHAGGGFGGHAHHGDHHYGPEGHDHTFTHERAPFAEWDQTGNDYATLHESAGILAPLHLGHVSLGNLNPEVLVSEVIALEAAGLIGDHLHDFPVRGHLDLIIPGALHCKDAFRGDEGRLVTWGKRNGEYKIKGQSAFPAVEIWSWPTGECDVVTFIERVATAPAGTYLGDLNAYGLGMIRRNAGLEEPQNANVPVGTLADRRLYEEFPEILSAAPFTSPDHKTNKPNGWYRIGKKECTGMTRKFRRVYQKPMKGLEGWRTYLIVQGAQWRFDIEYNGKMRNYWSTNVLFVPWSVEINLSGMWRYKWDQILEHRRCAEFLADATMRWTDSHGCDRYARAALRNLKPKQLEPLVPRKVQEVPPYVPGMVGVPAHDIGAGVDEDDARRWSTEQDIGPLARDLK